MDREDVWRGVGSCWWGVKEAARPWHGAAAAAARQSRWKPCPLPGQTRAGQHQLDGAR